MTKYELKKIFSRMSNKMALVLLVFITGIICYFATNVSYVNKNGDTKTGRKAVLALKTEQKQWSGYLDKEKIQKVIAKNRAIAELRKALPDGGKEKEITYSKGQGIMDIRELLNCSYADEFRSYDYYKADSLTEDDASNFYDNRILLLKNWLNSEAKSQFSKEEKTYLIKQYEKISVPFYYDYMKGWIQLFEFAPTVIMITMLILGYLVAGIFSNEFLWKADTLFFTAQYGRNKAVLAKIKAGFCMITVLYFGVFLLFTGITLVYLGVDGWNLSVQVDFGSWKCFYNIKIWQKYLVIMIGGYIGCFFLSSLSMFVSAKTKSAVLAVMLPFIVIFLPSFIENLNSPIVNKILGLLPDQLLQIGNVLNYFNLYSLGGGVIGALPILLVLYTVLTAILFPVIYWEYRRK